MIHENYEQQAVDFLSKTNTTLAVKYLKHAIYSAFNDGKYRDIYEITLSKDNRKYIFTFGQSLKKSDNGKSKPTAYDVLACLTKYPPESFAEFCLANGYDIDSRNAERVYNAVKEEYINLERLYSEEELEQLAEIS